MLLEALQFNSVRNAVLSLIDRENDPAKRKAMIMLAREKGHISDSEAEDWIVLDGLVDA